MTPTVTHGAFKSTERKASLLSFVHSGVVKL